MFPSTDKAKTPNPENKASFWGNLKKNALNLGVRLAIVAGTLGAAGGAMAETTNNTKVSNDNILAKTEIKNATTTTKDAPKVEIATTQTSSKPTNTQPSTLKTSTTSSSALKPTIRPNLAQTKADLSAAPIESPTKTVSELNQIPTNLKGFYDQTNVRATEINNQRRLEDLKKQELEKKVDPAPKVLVPIRKINPDTVKNRDLLNRPVGDTNISGGSTTTINLDSQGKLSPSFSLSQNGKTERGLNDRGVFEFRSNATTFHTSEILLQEVTDLKYLEEIKIYNFSVAMNIISATMKDGKPEYKSILGSQYNYTNGIDKTSETQRNSFPMSNVSSDTVAKIQVPNSTFINPESTLLLKVDGAGIESQSSSSPNRRVTSTQQRLFVSGTSERILQANNTQAMINDINRNTVLFTGQTQNQVLNTGIVNALAQVLPKLSNDLPNDGTPNINVNPILIKTSNSLYRGMIPQANVFHTSISTSEHPKIGELLPVVNSIAYGIGYSQVYDTIITNRSRIFDIKARSPFLSLNIDNSNANLRFTVNQLDQNNNSSIFSNVNSVGTDFIYDIGVDVNTQKASRENEIKSIKKYYAIPELYFTARTGTELDSLQFIAGTTIDTRDGFNPFAKLVASHKGINGEFANFALQYFVRPNDSQQSTISANFGYDFTSGDTTLTPYISTNISLAGALKNSYPNTAVIGLNLKSNVFNISLRQLFNLGSEFTSGTDMSLRVKLSDNFNIWGSYSNQNIASDISVGSSIVLGPNNNLTIKFSKYTQTGLPPSTNASILWQNSF